MVFRAYLVDGVWHIIAQKANPDGTMELREYAVSDAELRETVAKLDLTVQREAGLAKGEEHGD